MNIRFTGTIGDMLTVVLLLPTIYLVKSNPRLYSLTFGWLFWRIHFEWQTKPKKEE